MKVNGSDITVEIGASSDQATRKVQELTDALRECKAVLSNGWNNPMGGAGGSGGRGNVGKEMDTIRKKAGLLSVTLSSLQRIAFYRVIRSAIKAIGQAFSEGAENAYWYSKQMGGSIGYVAEAFDRTASAGFKMSNQLGAALATLKATVTPILIDLANLVTKVANFFTQLFAALGGKTTYMKAVDYTKQAYENTARGAAAAKEWKNQLLAFDEINKLEKPSEGGGGAGGALDDYENMFEEAKVSNFLSRLKMAIDDIFFDASGLNPEVVLEKLITAISGGLGGAIGFMIGGMPGALIGMTVGAGVGVLISSLIFNGDGQLDKSEILHSLAWALTGVVGGLIGFAVTGNILGALIGAAIGMGVTLAIEALTFKFNNSDERSKYKDGLSWFLCGVLGLPTDEELKGWGKSVIEWLGEGFKDLGADLEALLIQPFKDAWEKLKEWWSTLSLPKFHIPTPHISVNWNPVDSLVAQFFGITALPSLSVDWFAKGGFPEEGQLFMAREAGAELVGSIGNRTAVVNNDQIVASVSQGVAEAVASVLGGANNNQPIEVRVFLDSKEIRAGQQRLARATGSA